MSKQFYFEQFSLALVPKLDKPDMQDTAGEVGTSS